MVSMILCSEEQELSVETQAPTFRVTLGPKKDRNMDFFFRIGSKP